VTGRLAAVCAVHALVPDRGGDLATTAIDKRPLDGDVEIGPLGVAGDRQMDTRHHGGPDQAVYAYAREDAAWWAAELSREVPPGLFGENLATEGIDITGAVIGEQWQVGEPGTGPLLKVRSPRTPCSTFQAWLDEPHWVKRFTEHGATGAYLAVVRPGRVRAGDPVEVVGRPAHGVTIGQVFAGRRSDPEVLRRLLAHDDLDPKLRRALARALPPSG
jgi:MOSC domain-containing protein YiiM